MTRSIRMQLKAHDLPPRWDGAPVTWEGWDVSPVIICGAPLRPDPCQSCGMNHPRSVNRGVVHTDVRRRTRTGNIVPLCTARHLYAYRCPSCGHDQVMEMPSGDWWDLDATDYGDDGSERP